MAAEHWSCSSGVLAVRCIVCMSTRVTGVVWFIPNSAVLGTRFSGSVVIRFKLVSKITNRQSTKHTLASSKHNNDKKRNACAPGEHTGRSSRPDWDLAELEELRSGSENNPISEGKKNAYVAEFEETGVSAVSSALLPVTSQKKKLFLRNVANNGSGPTPNGQQGRRAKLASAVVLLASVLRGRRPGERWCWGWMQMLTKGHTETGQTDSRLRLEESKSIRVTMGTDLAIKPGTTKNVCAWVMLSGTKYDEPGRGENQQKI